MERKEKKKEQMQSTCIRKIEMIWETHEAKKYVGILLVVFSLSRGMSLNLGGKE